MVRKDLCAYCHRARYLLDAQNWVDNLVYLGVAGLVLELRAGDWGETLEARRAVRGAPRRGRRR